MVVAVSATETPCYRPVMTLSLFVLLSASGGEGAGPCHTAAAANVGWVERRLPRHISPAARRRRHARTAGVSGPRGPRLKLAARAGCCCLGVDIDGGFLP